VTRAALILAVLLATSARADDPPRVVVPGSLVETASGPVLAIPDKTDLSFGGLYISAAEARRELEHLQSVTEQRDQARQAAAQCGSSLRPFGVGLGIGLVAGSLPAALTLASSTPTRVSMAAGSAALGALLIWLSTR
jgi:hypothetical protein